MKNISQVNTKLINQQPHHHPNQGHLKAEPFLPAMSHCKKNSLVPFKVGYSRNVFLKFAYTLAGTCSTL